MAPAAKNFLLAPFRHVPVHVEELPAVRFVTANLLQAAGLTDDLVDAERGRGARATGILPLGLGRESELERFLLLERAELGAEFIRLVPRNVFDRHRFVALTCFHDCV